MAALSGEKTLAELSAEFGVHPTMISDWKQELVKRAGELFARGNRAPAVGDAQKVIDDLHRKVGQLQVERDFLAGQPAISRLLRGGRSWPKVRSSSCLPAAGEVGDEAALLTPGSTVFSPSIRCMAAGRCRWPCRARRFPSDAGAS